MSKKYNWAILGCGKIAKKFSSDLKLLPNANLYAAASRSIKNAQDFANEFDYKKAYGSYQEMVEDQNVDIVYIATPHSFHLEHTLLCLKHKKAVLCEKALAINSKEVKKMISASKENNTFLMEAFWTIFQPQFLKIAEIVKSKELGNLKFVKSDFMFNAEFDAEKRLYNINLGAGSLLDIGIYPIFTSLYFFGKPNKIKTIANIRSTGVEDSIAMLFSYDNGAIAVLTSSFESSCKNETEFCFENGFMKVERNSVEPILMNKNGLDQFIDFDNISGMGYELEASHVMDCLDKNLIESPILPHSFSLDLIEILDAVRYEAGIVFPNHD
ncbi:MAG: Gfo/Idh/MocA family oxidoreductase [Bacteroidota bacterium]